MFAYLLVAALAVALFVLAVDNRRLRADLKAREDLLDSLQGFSE